MCHVVVVVWVGRKGHVMARVLMLVFLVFGLLGSAVVHLLEWDNWAYTNEVIGPLFLVNVGAGIVITAAVLLWRHWLPLLAAVGYGAATLGAYLLSLTVGLFGVEQQLSSSAEVWGLVTDIACIVFGGLLLLRRDWRSAESDRTATPGATTAG